MSSGGIFRQWMRRVVTVPRPGAATIVALGVAGLVGAIGAIAAPLPARADSADSVSSVNSVDSAPTDVLDAIDRLESAANDRDLASLMDVYDRRFTHADGFDRAALREATEQFWARYETLTYDVELLAWEETATGYVTETEVTISGITNESRPFQIESALRSRQTFNGDRIVSQTTLEEASVLTAGSAPPTVRVQLPDRAAPGERFEFDAIVLEPLGSDFLLGGALEERIDGRPDPGASAIALQPLSAGGLFKTGTASAEGEDLWISGAIVRKDGITIVTQRLPIALTPTANEADEDD